MAKDAVDHAIKDFPVAPPSITERVPLLGAWGFEARTNQRVPLSRESGIEVGMIDHLLGRYGGLIDEVLELIRSRPELAQPLEGAVALPRRRDRLRRLARGCPAPRRRAHAAYAHLDRDLRPGGRLRPPDRAADGRRPGLGRARASRRRSTTTCAASRPSGSPSSRSPTRKPTRRACRRPTSSDVEDQSPRAARRSARPPSRSRLCCVRAMVVSDGTTCCASSPSEITAPRR